MTNWDTLAINFVYYGGWIVCELGCSKLSEKFIFVKQFYCGFQFIAICYFRVIKNYCLLYDFAALVSQNRKRITWPDAKKQIQVLAKITSINVSFPNGWNILKDF